METCGGKAVKLQGQLFASSLCQAQSRRRSKQGPENGKESKPNIAGMAKNPKYIQTYLNIAKRFTEEGFFCRSLGPSKQATRNFDPRRLGLKLEEFKGLQGPLCLQQLCNSRTSKFGLLQGLNSM